MIFRYSQWAMFVGDGINFQLHKLHQNNGKFYGNFFRKFWYILNFSCQIIMHGSGHSHLKEIGLSMGFLINYQVFYQKIKVHILKVSEQIYEEIDFPKLQLKYCQDFCQNIKTFWAEILAIFLLQILENQCVSEICSEIKWPLKVAFFQKVLMNCHFLKHCLFFLKSL